ncbi:MAG: hypothetical protein KGD58_10645 [Candidatus Lokiarchaeota archaeon]|nr:hypothetical protein [Candidatus Lokiarchaeota archaeon]
MLVPATTQKIQIVCPICKTRDLIGVPKRELNKSTHLTTISIHKGLICPHHFQVFVDKNLQIRGYQKVDFELSDENSKKLRNGVIAFNQNEKEEKSVFKTIVNETVKLPSKENKKSVPEVRIEKKKTMKDIYDEFWEFIDDDSETFQNFIINDKRRQNHLSSFSFNESYNHLELDQEI